MASIFLSSARGDDEPFVRSRYERLRLDRHEVCFDRECMPARALTFLQEIAEKMSKLDI